MRGMTNSMKISSGVLRVYLLMRGLTNSMKISSGCGKYDGFDSLVFSMFLLNCRVYGNVDY